MATSDDKKAFLSAVADYNRKPSKSKAIEIFDRFLNPHKATQQFMYLPHDVLQPVATQVQTYRGWLFERDRQFSGGGLKAKFARFGSSNQFKAQPGVFAPAARLIERIGFMPTKRHKALDRPADPQVVAEVKARLRGKDLLTLLDANISQRYSEDKAKATDRLDEVLAKHRIDPLGVASVALAEQLVAHLQKSRLTINFSANNLFSRSWDVLGSSYKNIWQLPTGVKSDKYLDDRDLVEEDLRGFSNPQPFFSSPRPRARRNAVYSRESALGLHRAPQQVLDEITHYSRRTSPDGTSVSSSFHASSRAQYAALDFLEAKFGGAVFYGRSFFVLDNRLLMNGTVTHTDTFDKSGKPASGWQEVLANYHNLYPVVAYMDEDLLLKLLAAARGGAAGALHAGGGYSYVECQFQGDAVFGREIREMYVSEAELALSFDMTDPVNEMMEDGIKEMRQQSWGADRLRSNIRAFAKAYGIKLEFIDDRQYSLDLSGKERFLPAFAPSF